MYGVDNPNAEATALIKDYLDTDFKIEFKEEYNGEYRVILNDKDECLNEIVLEEGWGEYSDVGIEKWGVAEKKAKEGSRGIWGNDRDD